MNQIGTYNGRDYQITRFYFTGTTTLGRGQSLAFMEVATTSSAPIVPNAGSYANAVRSFPFDVKIPDANNHSSTTASVFAGIVAESSVGKTGPGYIDVIVPKPGDIIQVAVSQSAAIAVGDLLKLNNTVGTITTLAGVAYSGAGATISSQLSSSNLGAFDAFSFAVTSSTDVQTSNLNANFVSAFKVQPLVQALESIASVDTSTSTRALMWVRFI